MDSAMLNRNRTSWFFSTRSWISPGVRLWAVTTTSGPLPGPLLLGRRGGFLGEDSAPDPVAHRLHHVAFRYGKGRGDFGGIRLVAPEDRQEHLDVQSAGRGQVLVHHLGRDRKKGGIPPHIQANVQDSVLPLNTGR